MATRPRSSGLAGVNADELTGPADRAITDQGRQRRQELLDAAMALFAERGYAATRIIDICERAGVAKGLFYWYFPTKHELFAELVRTMQLRLRRAQAAAIDPDGDAVTRIRQGTVASVSFIADHAEYFDLVDAERADAAVSSDLRAATRVYLADVRALICAAQRAGLVDDRDPTLLSLGVIGAVGTYTSSLRRGRVALSAAELAEFVADWVVRGLTGTAAP